MTQTHRYDSHFQYNLDYERFERAGILVDADYKLHERTDGEPTEFDGYITIEEENA